MKIKDLIVINSINNDDFEPLKIDFEPLKIDFEEEYEYQHLKSIEKILEDDEEKEDELKFESLDDEKIDNILTNDSENILTNDESKTQLDKYKTNKYKLITRRIDNNRIRHKVAKSVEVHSSICKNVRMNEEIPSRSGAIIYTHHQGKTYFCMGVDSVYGDLTDFAGGVKKDETILEGGLRELEEESQGIFGKLTVEQILNCLCFYCSNMLIIFIRLDIDMEASRREFSSKVVENHGVFMDKNDCENTLEVSNIVWLETKDFLNSISGNLLNGKKMYSRVRKILSKVVDIVEVL